MQIRSLVAPAAALRRWTLGGLADAPVEVQTQLLATMLQRPLTLALSSVTLLLVCGTSVVVTGTDWAVAWFLVTLAIIAWRILHPVLASRLHRPTQLWQVVAASILLFGSFGLGCAACIATRAVDLSMMSTVVVLGIVAGLASRWAAVPRLAVSTMTITSLPPLLAMLLAGGVMELAALSFALVVVSVAAFTVQNRANLVGMVMAENLSRHLARTDHLTGLTNRAELGKMLDRACRALSGRQATERRFAVLYLDLDGFKGVNDSFGHAKGDQLLREVSSSIQALVNGRGDLSRIGGDEFVVLLPGADETDACATARRIVERITGEHDLGAGCIARIGCSIGVALAPEQGQEPELLIARADSALYEVKRRGRGTFQVWQSP
jgi:diguanylate cyclase (GGDEF)-like protein